MHCATFRYRTSLECFMSSTLFTLKNKNIAQLKSIIIYINYNFVSSTLKQRAWTMRRSKQNSVTRCFQLSKNYTQKLLMNEFNLANLLMYKADCKVSGCNQSCLHDIPVHRLLLWLLGCISSHLTLSSHPSYSKHFLQKINVINIKSIILEMTLN